MKINLRKLLLDGLLEESFPITPEPKLPQEPVEVPTESDGTKDLYESDDRIKGLCKEYKKAKKAKEDYIWSHK